VSYVRCQRCERPVCPACQRPAAVGVQCLDCVREQAAGQRQARTTFGGRPTDGRPVVTLGIIGACIVVFVLQLALGERFTSALAFYPALAQDEPWRFVTGAFLHSPGFLLHIAFNLIILWQIGPVLEQQLARLRFLALYLLSAIGGSVGYLLLADPAQGSWYTQVVGASGAVFGLFGALVVVNRRLGVDSRGIIGLIAVNAVIGFVPGLNIAWQAHLGGLVTGAVAAAVLVHAPRARRPLVQGLGLVAVLLLLVVLSTTKLATSPTLYPQGSAHPGDRVTRV
jgi:membrane associated rhomboid family serine protease